MKISDLMDVIEDDSVPIREQSGADSQRIREITMRKIHNEEITMRKNHNEDENEDERKRPQARRTGRRTAVIILAACLALAVTAYAAGTLGLVNWKGETVPEDNTVLPTPVPDTETVAEDSAAAIGRALLEGPSHGRDLLTAKAGTHTGVLPRTEDCTETRQLQKLLEAEGTGMTADWRVPEGYTLAGGWTAFDLAAGYEYHLASTETTSDGVTVERYTAPETGDFVSSYFLEYVNAAGNTLTISAQMLTGIWDMEFGQAEGTAMEPVKVPGMDHALAAAGREDVSLFAGKTLSQSVAYVDPLTLDVQADQAYYDGILYRLWSDSLDADALVEIVTN